MRRVTLVKSISCFPFFENWKTTKEHFEEKQDNANRFFIDCSWRPSLNFIDFWLFFWEHVFCIFFLDFWDTWAVIFGRFFGDVFEGV